MSIGKKIAHRAEAVKGSAMKVDDSTADLRKLMQQPLADLRQAAGRARGAGN